MIKMPDTITVNYCPECGEHSGEMELSNPGVKIEEERLCCDCGWEGKWEDMDKREEDF